MCRYLLTTLEQNLFHCKRLTKLLQSMCLIWIVFILSLQPVLADLQYIDRGNRYEGVKERQVAGGGVKLISAVINQVHSIQQDNFGYYNLNFYLPNHNQVRDIVVQELKQRKYYWLDKVKIDFFIEQLNNFKWSTKDVIEPLSLSISDLGAVVYLSTPYDNGEIDDYVAPALFYSGKLSSLSKPEYYFSFRLSARARVSYSIRQKGSEDEIYSVGSDEVPSDYPVVIPIGFRLLPTEGIYELQIKGTYLSSYNDFSYIVAFYHKQNLPSMLKQ